MYAKEPVLENEENNRLSALPVRFADIYEMYNKHVAMFWTVDEVQLSQDLEHWEQTLTDAERQFIKMILAFFAVADGLVNANLDERFIKEIRVKEAQIFYAFQEMMENVHNVMYGTLIQAYIKSQPEARALLDSIKNYPVIAKKCAWCTKWIEQEAPLAQRLAAFAVIEGVFFSGSFCAIYWVKSRGLMPGLCQSNELIARDERMHVDFAVLLYTRYIKYKLDAESMSEMVREAVQIECEFIQDILPESFGIMNKDNMMEYIRFTADELLTQLGYPRVYKARQPFSFMDNINMRNDANFFEQRDANYQVVPEKSEQTSFEDMLAALKIEPNIGELHPTLEHLLHP